MQAVESLRCKKCGELCVVYYLRIAGARAIIKMVCPTCHRKKPLRLPIETRDQWIGAVTEQIYRCAMCGQSISEPVKVSRQGRWVVLHLECPVHGLRESKRHILDTLYPVIQNIHQRPMGAMQPPTFGPPQDAYPPPPPPPPPAGTQIPPPPPTSIPPPPIGVSPYSNVPAAGKVTFCPDCGATLQPGALFCVQCGAEINEDAYDEY